MANLGVSKRSMSIIFVLMVLGGSLMFSIYIVLLNKLTCKIEGFDKLEPMCKSEFCEGESAHEVPIWEGSIVPEKPKVKRVDESTYAAAEQTPNKSKRNKYSALDNQIDQPVEDNPAAKPPTEQKFLSDLVKTKGKRPKATSTGLVKQPKGAHTGLGFNTGAMN